MPRKKVRRYGDYTRIIKGELYAVVNLRQSDGTYKRKYKKVDNKTTALQWALEQLEKHKKGSSYDASLTFEDFADWYSQEFLHTPFYENNVKVEGVKDYERQKNKVEKFKEFFKERKISEFNENDLRRWQKFRRDEEKVSTATLNRDFALLRAMFRKGLKFKRVLSVPEFPINMHAEKERDRVMSFDEEKRILAACTTLETITKKRRGIEYQTTIEAKREHLKPIIIIAVDTAMRAGEIFSLTWNDIDLKTGVITVRFFNSKTQKSRIIGMTPRVKEAFAALFEVSDKKKTSKVFGIKRPYRAFRTACARARVKDLVFHDLRHSGTTRMVRAGLPTAEVMKITGHTQLKTFMRYLNLVNETVQSNASQLAAYIEQSTKT